MIVQIPAGRPVEFSARMLETLGVGPSDRL